MEQNVLLCARAMLFGPSFTEGGEVDEVDVGENDEDEGGT